MNLSVHEASQQPANHHHGHHHASRSSHGHTHEPFESPGVFPLARATRPFAARAFTVGIGGPVGLIINTGSGKTALVLALCRSLPVSLCVVTNDIFTKEDTEFLVRNNALADGRVVAVETGGCPHAAIREDISMNLNALELLHQKFSPEMMLLESGGDNLA